MLRDTLALASLLPLACALSNADIESVFGAGATDLSGSSITLPQFVFSVVTNATHALVSLNQSASPSSVGWMGTGVGSAMPNADFLVTWPNLETAGASSAWTLSHRDTPAQVMPVAASTSSGTTTSDFFTYLPALSTTDGTSPFTLVSYLRPLSFPSNYVSTAVTTSITRGVNSFIYASSTVKPANTAETATLTQHDQAHATISFDLSQAISLGGASGTATSSGAGSSSTSVPFTGGLSPSNKLSRSKRDMYLIAHAVVGTLGLLLFTPIAILIGRFFRSSTWFPFHAALNLLAAALVICAFALGYTQTRGKHFFDTHTKAGLALLILVVVQVFVGAFAHRIPTRPTTYAYRFPTLAGKSPVRLAHILLGIAITLLGFAQIRLGFAEYPKESDGGQSVPKTAIIVFWVVAAVEVVLCIGGWIKEAAGGTQSSSNTLIGGAEKEPGM